MSTSKIALTPEDPQVLAELPDRPPEMRTMSVAEFAEAVGITKSAVHVWCLDGKVPAEKVMNERYGKAAYAINSALVEPVKALIKEHGRSWHRHADFSEFAVEQDEVEGDQEEAAAVEAEAEAMTLGDRVKERIVAAHTEGDFKLAADLALLMMEHYTFSEPS